MAQRRLGEVRAARLAKRAALVASGQVLYPSEARRTHRAADWHKQFVNLVAENTPVTVAGRVTGVRRHGRIVFVNVADPTGSVQLYMSADEVPSEIFTQLDYLDAGDFIQAAGSAGKTKRGTPTLVVREWHLLSKSIRPLPGRHFGLKDTEARLRQREVDLLLNPASAAVLHVRSRVTGWLRGRLSSDGYLEVETPILQATVGGAWAEPFTTHHKALGLDLHLRIAPELYLKRLLVGGFEKVFELGRVFRNEGIDRDHNPEFTMCELYWAYADYEDLMDYTEQLLAALVADVHTSDTLVYQREELMFTPPWPRVRYIDRMRQELGFDILAKKEPERYVAEFAKRRLAVPAVSSYVKLLDGLYKELVRPTFEQPTIVYDYPLEMAPLAKRSTQDERVAEQFQVIAAGVELIKAYTELNDPVEQRERFAQQKAARLAGDAEIAETDETYLQALELGMPPAAGLGLGVDRLVALLAGCSSIRETVAFPLLKP
ncbi:MAG: lysine--tRNA ligase [Candidatus Andersenbacteria bacterium]|nr:lysine--tRNA ligase [Candidatus Andersenbacteria bacterium]